MATVNNVNSTGAPGFRYEYLVTPKLEAVLAKDGLLLSGTAYLYWDPDEPTCRELRGTYYNAPPDSRFGDYVLHRTEKTSSSWRREQEQKKQSLRETGPSD
jgi:hypothetical protein